MKCFVTELNLDSTTMRLLGKALARAMEKFYEDPVNREDALKNREQMSAWLEELEKKEQLPSKERISCYEICEINTANKKISQTKL